MNKFFCIGLAGALWLVATSVGAETLAMTVKYDYGDPSGGSSHWTAEYYTDVENRLVRISWTFQGELEGDPETNEQESFLWTSAGVESVGAGEGTDRISFEWTTVGMRMRWGILDKMYRLVAEQPDLVWEDETHRHSWSAIGGYQMIVKPDSSQEDSASITTNGSRVSRLVRDRVTDFALLDIRPRELVASYYASFLDDDVWLPVGTVVFGGRGLAHPDARTRLVHAMLVGRSFNLPIWAPMILGK